jgi:hypothetical protein
VDLYKVPITNGLEDSFIIPKYKAVNPKNGEILNKKTIIDPTDP